MYNWQAAMQLASAYDGVNVTYPDGAPSTTNFIQGICPQGWHVPSAGSSSEFLALDTAAGSPSTGFWQPGGNWKGVYSGGVDNYGPFDYQGSYGGCWSSTQYHADSAHFLYFTSSTVIPSDYLYKDNGFAVRCIKN